MTFVAEDSFWADVFAHQPGDDWYRRPADDKGRELTLVDEDTFWAAF